MEQAKTIDTEAQSRLVRIRLLENIASPEGPNGYAGDVLTVLEEVALRLIECGAAIELADPAPAVEERSDTGSDPAPLKTEGTQPKQQRSQPSQKVSGEK